MGQHGDDGLPRGGLAGALFAVQVDDRVRDVGLQGRHEDPGEQSTVLGGDVEQCPQLVEVAASLGGGKRCRQGGAAEQDRRGRDDLPPVRGDADGASGVVAEVEPPLTVVVASHPQVQRRRGGGVGLALEHEECVGEGLLWWDLAVLVAVGVGELGAQGVLGSAQHADDLGAVLGERELLALEADPEGVSVLGEGDEFGRGGWPPGTATDGGSAMLLFLLERWRVVIRWDGHQVPDVVAGGEVVADVVAGPRLHDGRLHVVPLEGLQRGASVGIAGGVAVGDDDDGGAVELAGVLVPPLRPLPVLGRALVVARRYVPAGVEAVGVLLAFHDVHGAAGRGFLADGREVVEHLGLETSGGSRRGDAEVLRLESELLEQHTAVGVAVRVPGDHVAPRVGRRAGLLVQVGHGQAERLDDVLGVASGVAVEQDTGGFVRHREGRVPVGMGRALGHDVTLTLRLHGGAVADEGVNEARERGVGHGGLPVRPRFSRGTKRNRVEYWQSTVCRWERACDAAAPVFSKVTPQSSQTAVTVRSSVQRSRLPLRGSRSYRSPSASLTAAARSRSLMPPAPRSRRSSRAGSLSGPGRVGTRSRSTSVQLE
jgi:hypothetical protein